MKKLHPAAAHATTKLELLSELQKAHDKITYLSSHDTLTSLNNRVFFDKKIQNTIKKNPYQLHAVLLLDIDNFRNVYNLLGYESHETTLKQVAQRIQACLKVEDFAARQESDKFIICLVNVISKKEIHQRLQKIFNAFTLPFNIQQSEFYLTASIGIATYPAHSKTSELLIHYAHTACHHAKMLGKNNCQFFAEKIEAKTRQSTQIETQLHYALMRKEFSLHYQPQIDISNHALIGVEALIRWNNPKLGRIPPLNFIPLAEQNGLISPINNWVIEHACNQMKLWKMNLKPMQIAINFSAQEFQTRTSTLIQRIKSVLQINQLQPTQLELELTESSIIKNYKTVLPIMKALRDLGVRIACDDFGTGYSSLTQLKRLPIDTLKIDKSFVDDISSSSNDIVVIQAIISMAKKLNLRVIAEGVENRSQIDILKQLGCTTIQGYYFSKPLPAKLASHWFSV